VTVPWFSGFRLQHLCHSPDDEVRQTAALVLEVARVKPGKRKRTGWLAAHRPDLLARLARLGLLDGFVQDWDGAAEADEETRVDSADGEVPF
jgi:hypothetical protein